MSYLLIDLTRFYRYYSMTRIQAVLITTRQHNLILQFCTFIRDLHTRLIPYFKYNSSVFGLGTTNCSKTDRKQIYIAVYKVIFPRGFCLRCQPFYLRLQTICRTCCSLGNRVYCMKLTKIAQIDDNQHILTKCLPELS